MQGDFDFAKGPGKAFIEGVHVRIINGLLNITLQSGESYYPFLATLDIAKKLSRALSLQVGEIEVKNKIEIDGRLPHEPMPSPIQIERKGSV